MGTTILHNITIIRVHIANNYHTNLKKAYGSDFMPAYGKLALRCYSYLNCFKKCLCSEKVKSEWTEQIKLGSDCYSQEKINVLAVQLL
jgi:hypothetical protein